MVWINVNKELASSNTDYLKLSSEKNKTEQNGSMKMIKHCESMYTWWVSKGEIGKKGTGSWDTLQYSI
jgi:hypothetical protein